MRLWVDIPENLEDKFIVIADIQGKTLDEVIEQLIKNYIRRNKKLLESEEAKKLLS